MSPTRSATKSNLEVMLQSRFAMAKQVNAAAPPEREVMNDILLPEQSVASAPATWLGRQPSAAAIASSAEAIWKVLEDSKFGVGAAQLGGPSALADMVTRGLCSRAPFDVNERSRGTVLASVYEPALSQLRVLGVNAAELCVVSMVCAGGAPWAHYGLGDAFGKAGEEGRDGAADAQVELALKYGMVFDLIPLFLSDFNGSILGLAAGVATVLLARLRLRDEGRLHCDGVLFACKGTLAAALASAAYSSEARGRGVALVGMGTDLTQGFLEGVQGGGVEATKAAAQQPLLVINSLQDDNVGAGGQAVLREWAAGSEAADERGSSPPTPTRDVEWVDVDSWCERLGWQENPHHSWYPKAFGARGEAPLKHALLARMAGFVRRCEPAVAVEAA